MSVEQYCRLCATLSMHCVNIFDELGKQHLLFLKIINNLNIVLFETDPLSKYVCILCIGKLDFTERFKRECQTAQSSLRKLLGVRPPAEVIITDNIKSKESDNEENCVDDKNGNKSCGDSNEVRCFVFVDSQNINAKEIFQSGANKASDDCSVINCDGDDNDLDCNLSKNTIVDDGESQGQGDTFVDVHMEVEDEEDPPNEFDDNDLPIDNVEPVIGGSDEDITSSIKEISTNVQIPAETQRIMKNDNDEKSGDGCNKDERISDKNVEGDITSCGDKDNNSDLVDRPDYDDSNVVTVREEICVDDNKMESIEQFYFRLVEKQSWDAKNGEHLLRMLSYVNNLIESKCSMMPYFLRWKSLNCEPRFGFKCPLCHHYWFDRIAILKHVTQHCYFMCSKCNNKMFGFPGKFKKHFNRCHAFDCSVEKINCKNCGDLFKTIDSYIKHAPCNFIYSCGVCSFKTKLSDLFNTHMKTEHVDEKENCSLDCCSLFMCENDMKKHLLAISKSNKGFVCKSCEMVFHKKEFLDIHYNIYGENHGFDKTVNGETVIDDICSEPVASSSNVKSVFYAKTPTDAALEKRIASVYKLPLDHKLIIDFYLDVLNGKIKLEQLPLEKRTGTMGATGNGFVFRCPSCRNRLSSVNTDGILQHMEHHFLRTCFYCKKLFKMSNVFALHFKKKHANCKNFTCYSCKDNVEFMNINDYLTHVRHHSSKRICKHCRDIFPCANDVQKHIRKMHKDVFNKKKKIVCEHCGDKFQLMCDLKNHIKYKHLNLSRPVKVCVTCGAKYHGCHYCRIDERKDFICAYCSKGFSRKVPLINHIAVHMNEKKFNCNLCSKKFNRVTSLEKHKKDMHSVRKWQCHVENCNSSYSYKSALLTHLKNSHKNC